MIPGKEIRNCSWSMNNSHPNYYDIESKRILEDGLENAEN